MHLTVLIATYQRPAYLVAAVHALWNQTRRPDHIVVVTRDTDAASDDAVRRLLGGPVPLTHGRVRAPGHLPPLLEGRRRLPDATDVVVQLDDDLVAHPDALARVETAFAAPSLGLLAGRIVEHDGGTPRPPRRGYGGGEVSFSGRIRGGHADHPTERTPRPTQWATGAFAAYRRCAFDRIAIRDRLNVNVAVGYEIDWGLQIAAMGYRVVFDPEVVGDHHNAPRAHGTTREALHAPAAVFARTHNHTYVLLHHLRGTRRVAFLARSFVLGDRCDWALGAAVYATVFERSLRWRRAMPHAYRGRIAALAHYVGDRIAG